MTTNRPRRLPIIVDAPSPRPGLGFDSYAEGIAAAVLDGEPARFTVGLYGPWGTGKSSLLRSVQAHIENQSGTAGRPEAAVVMFDAWRYEREPNLILPLLAQVVEALKGTDSWHAKVREKVGSALRSLEFSASIPFLDVKLSQAGSEARYVNPYRELRDLGKAFQSSDKPRRIVVMIDDLDRCSPDAVVSVLEAIHLLTDVEGFVFLLALDYEYLISAIAKRYPGGDSQKFIEKIIQIPFRIPQAEIKNDQLIELVETWDDLRKEWFAGVDGVTLEKVARLALRSNPRQLKRLLNSFMLTRFMKWEETSASPDLLARVIGLQLAWPLYFANLHREISNSLADFASDDDVVSLNLRTVTAVAAFTDVDGDLEQRALFADDVERETQTDIREYLLRLFPSSLDAGQVLALMNLTREVVEPEREEVEEPEDIEREGYRAPRAMPPVDPHAIDDLLEMLATTTTELAADIEIREQKTYTVARFTGNGRKLVFATFFRRVNRVDVQLPLDAASLVADGIDPAEFIDQGGKATLGVGGVLVRVRPHDERARMLASRLIADSLRARTKSGGLSVNWTHASAADR